MSEMETNRWNLPLLQPAQAQKHVTVNEALMRLDGLVNLALQSRSVTTPPVTAAEGQCWAIPPDAVNEWAGQEGKIAIFANNGWVFATASIGMRAYVIDEGTQAIHDGADWLAGVIQLGASGSSLASGLAEGRVTLSAGSTVTSDVFIPSGSMVIGATARVSQAITGTLSAWQLGTAGALNRFGAGLGLGKNSWARGMLSQPMTYWNSEPLILTAMNGAFAGGEVQLAVHWLDLGLPRAFE